MRYRQNIKDDILHGSLIIIHSIHSEKATALTLVIIEKMKIYCTIQCTKSDRLPYSCCHFISRLGYLFELKF